MMHQNLKKIISFATAIMLLICAFGVSNAVLGVSGVTEVKVYQNDTLTKEENFNDVKRDGTRRFLMPTLQIRSALRSATTGRTTIALKSLKTVTLRLI